MKTSNQLQSRKTLVALAQRVAAVVLTPSKNKRKSKQRKDSDVPSQSDEDSPSDEDTPAPKQSSVGNPTRSTDDRSTSSSYTSSSEEFELKTPRPSPTPSTAETEEVVAEPDADINEEDPDEGDDEDVNLAATMHRNQAAILDEDTQRRNERMRKYLTEKVKLIREAETFVKSVQPKGLEKGALVETRKKDSAANEPERGFIVEKVWDDQGSGAGGGKKKFKWKLARYVRHLADILIV